MTRDEIMNLKVGDAIEHSLTGETHWSPTTVTRIFSRGLDVKGRAYVCLYTQFGPTAEMSCSTHEGEPNARLRLPAAEIAPGSPEEVAPLPQCEHCDKPVRGSHEKTCGSDECLAREYGL